MGPLTKVKKVKPSKSSKLSSPLKSNIMSKKAKKTNQPKRISSQPGLKKIVKVQKRKFDPIKANRGVVYIKHIPHGFYEEQMQKYFEQFGHVTRVRLARSERTGRSKGYAFVEFKVPEVAKIAADTMDNYIMFKQVLKTVYIPPEQQKTNYFRADVRFTTNGQGVRTFTSPKVERIKKQVENINRIKTDEEHAKKIEQAKYKLKKQTEKYGVDLSSCLYSGDSSDVKPTASDEKIIKKVTKKKAKNVAKKKKISSSDDGKSLLHQLANETFEENDSSDEDFKIDSSAEINTSGEIENSFGENNATFGENDTSSDEETNNSSKKVTKKVEKKKKKISSSDDGKSLLYKLANETFEENDSSDDEFKIDHSFSASDDDTSSDTNQTSLVDLLASKLNAAHNPLKTKKQTITKKSGASNMTVTSVLVSETEKKPATKKEKKAKKTAKPSILKEAVTSPTNGLNDSTETEKKPTTKKEKKVAKPSNSKEAFTSATNGLNERTETEKKPTTKKEKKVAKPSNSKEAVTSAINGLKHESTETEKKPTTKKEKKAAKPSNSKVAVASTTNGLKHESAAEKVNLSGKRKRDAPDSTANAAVSEVKTNGKNKKSKQINTKKTESGVEIAVSSGEVKKGKPNLKSLKSKVNSRTEVDEEKQIKTKNVDVKKVKSGIIKKKVHMKAQMKNDKKKMVEQTPMELLAAWNKLAKVDKVKKSK